MLIKHMTEYCDRMAQTKSNLTVVNHKSTLSNFIAYVNVSDPSEILARDVMRYKNHLLETGTSGSVNTRIRRVKAFLNWMVDQKILMDSPADDINYTSVAEAVPKWLTNEERDRLIRAVKRDSIGSHLAPEARDYRNYTMVMMMLQTGMRLREVADLKWSDINLGDRKGYVLIRGKNGQQRKVQLVPDLLKVLKAYAENGGLKHPHVFFSRQSDRISPRIIQHTIQKYVDVVGTHITAHSLRHTFAHDLIAGGMQLEAVARLMGHIRHDGTPNIQQTVRYTKASDEEIGDGMERILSIN